MDRLPRVALACLLALAACGGAPEPVRHLRLADGFRPASVVPEGGLALHPVVETGPLRVHGEAGGTGLWIEHRIPESDWRSLGSPGLWVTARLLPGGGGVPAGGGPLLRLESESGAYEMVGLQEIRAGLSSLSERSFCAFGDSLYAYTNASGSAPGELVFREYLHRGDPQGDTWRAKVGSLRADGIPVLPGFREEVRCTLPPGSALRFVTAGVGCVDRRAGARAPILRFGVRLDGAPIFEHEQEVGMTVSATPHVVPLPSEGRRDARLVFEVEGDAANAAFLVPVVGPLEVGSYQARPWPEERDNIVLFLADTFRADNMAFYGGDPLLTPNLDRFAAQCLRFRNAWAPSAWTLPSHASMFSGLYPYQCGVTEASDRLSAEAVTLAERLREAGYRTGAVTDHVFVTSTHGLDQGFESFDELWVDLERTLRAAEAFLDADDGRPFFLFVHTYRTHVPYHVSEETLARLGEHLGLETGPDAPRRADPATCTPELSIAMYRGGAADLDLGFERFRAALDERGLLEESWLVFTSDHGEGLQERGDEGHAGIGHGDKMFEEHLRVPLLISGPRAPARVNEHPASPVDLPRTIASIAGVAPEPSWQGRSLLELDEDRPIYSYQCRRPPRSSSVVLVEGLRKLIAPADPEALREGVIEEAYDLRADPGEREDLTKSELGWPGELLESLLEDHLETYELRLDPSGVTLSPEELEQLRALGYIE
jgi:arylsulfatase A-like enzyme